MSTLSRVVPELWRLEFIDYKKSSVDEDQEIDDSNPSAEAPDEDQGDDPEESLFEDDDEGDEQDNGSKKVRMSKKKKALIGGGIGTGIAGSVIVVLVGFLPSRLISTVENLERTFFSNVNSAVDERMDTIVSTYIKKHVLPGLGGACSSTRVTSKCSVAPDESGRISRLYRAWSDNRFENKLATKYGLEFGKNGSNYYLIGSGQQIDLGGDGTGGFRNSNLNLSDYLNNNGVSSSSRGDIRRAVREATEGEFFFKRTLHRFKVGTLLERKYGIKRCVIACEGRDKFADWKDNKSKAMKMLFVNRVVMPRSERFGVLLSCLIAGSCTNPGENSSDGERRTAVEREAQELLARYASRFGTEAVENILKNVNNILDKGVAAHVVEKVFTKILGQASGKAAAKAVPILGWIDLGAQVITTIKDSPGVFKKMTYAANAAAAVQLYMMYVSHVDEVKSGNVDMELVGSFVGALGDTGNGGSAEATPLYQHLFSSSDESSSAFNLFPVTTLADGGQYVCNDGNVIAADQLVCPEDKLNGGNLLTDVLDVSSDVVAPLSYVTSIWTEGIAGINLCGGGNLSLDSIYGCAEYGIGKSIELLQKVPGVGSTVDKLSSAFNSALEPITNLLASQILPSPFPDNLDDMSGAKTFTMMGAGADVSANYYAHYGLGGRVLSGAEVAEIRNSEAAKLLDDFAAKPLYARLFDTTEPMSAVSKMAMSMPMDTKGLVQTFMSSVFNLPRLFGNISSLFFASPQASAANYPTGDPFGVVQYGYPLGSDELKSDPEAMTDEQCDAEIKAWEDSATEHEDTEATHDTVSLCKLDRAVIAAAGGIYDESLIDESTSPQPSPITSGQIISSEKVVADIKSDGQTPCPSEYGITDGGITTGMRNSETLSFRLCKLTNGALVNTIYAKRFAELFVGAEKAGQDLGAGGGHYLSSDGALARWKDRCGENYPTTAKWLSPPCTGNRAAPPGKSFHELGLAIDLTCNGTSLGGGTTTRSTFNPNAPCMQYVINRSPSLNLYLQCEGKRSDGSWIVESNCESWHISPTGG